MGCSLCSEDSPFMDEYQSIQMDRLDFTIYERRAEQIDATQFMIKHRKSATKNILIEMYDDEAN